MNAIPAIWLNVIFEYQMSMIGDNEDLGDMTEIGDFGDGHVSGRINSLGEYRHISLIGLGYLDVSFIGKVKIVNQRVSLEDMFKGIVGHIG